MKLVDMQDLKFCLVWGIGSSPIVGMGKLPIGKVVDCKFTDIRSELVRFQPYSVNIKKKYLTVNYKDLYFYSFKMSFNSFKKSGHLMLYFFVRILLLWQFFWNFKIIAFYKLINDSFNLWVATSF